MSDPQPAVPLDRLLAHRAWVRALARCLVSDENLADDVEQETWLAAVQHPPRHETSLRAWLSEVVRNAARKARRSAGRRERHERAAPSATPPRSDTRPGADLVAEAEMNQLLVRAVLDLEEPYRTTILLRWFDGLPPREVASRMDVPVETVRTRLKRAHERIRESLDGRFGGDRRAWTLAILAWETPSVPLPDGTSAPPATPPATAPSPSGPSTVPASAGTVAGVVAMGTLQKSVAALVAVALLAGAAWKLADSGGDVGGARDGEPAADAVVADGGATHSGPRTQRPGNSAPAPAAGPQDAAPAETGTVEVTVRTAAGLPIEGADVEAHVRPAGGPAAQNEPWRLLVAAPLPSSSGRTGADGVARLGGVPLDAPSDIVARRSGFAPASALARPRDAVTPAHAEILLVPGHSLAGRVVTAAGRAVEGALVVAGRGSDRSAQILGVSPRVARARTDPSGRFALRDLPGGEALLWAAYPEGPPIQAAVVLLPAVREVELVLPATATLSGMVRDEATKEPLAGARVSVQGTFRDSPFSAGGVAGADGTYRMSNLPAGAQVHTVRASAEGYVASDPYEPFSLALVEGEVHVLDISLLRGAVLTGTVRGDGDPLAGVTVNAAWPGTSTCRVATTRTGADGSYRLSGVRPGRVTVVVSAEGWLQEGLPGSWRRVVQAGIAPESAVVDVRADGVTAFDVALVRGRIVEGRVLHADGTPAVAARATASLEGRRDADGPWRLQGARAAADGTFRVSGIPHEAQIQMNAGLTGFGTSETVQLAPGAGTAASPVELRLRAPLTVRGTVTVPAGADPGDVWVEWTLSPVGRDAPSDEAAWALATCIPVVADRRFEVAGQMPGAAVTLRARSTRLPPSAPVRVVPDAAAPGADVALALSPGRNAVGRILDRDAGTPLAGARVHLLRADPLPREARTGGPGPLAPLVAVTSASGEFVLRDLGDGAYELHARADGRLPGSLRFEVPLAASLDLALAPSRTLTGRAVLADGRPAARVLVGLGVSGGAFASTTAADDGSFSFADLGDVPVDLWFGAASGTRSAGTNVLSKSLRGVRPGGEPVVVVLEPGLAIAGRVLDAAGAGVPRAWVQAANETPGAAGEPMSMTALTEADGSFVVRGLRPGRHTVQAGATSPGVPAAERPVVQKGVEAGATGLVLVFGAGLTIDGVVVGPGGRSLAGHMVQAGPVDEREMNYAYLMGPSSGLGADGRFRIEGLAAGRYRLRLFDDGSRPSSLQFDDASAVVDAGATGLRLVAAAGTTIAGRVTLGPDAPLSDIPVNAVRVGNDAESLHGTSGSDGRFILLGAKPGATYDMRTSLLGIVQGRVRGVATGASDVHLRCEKGRGAKGRAVNAKGEPAPKVLLWFTSDGEESSSSCTTDAEGDFEVAGLTDSPHRVRFETFVLQTDGTRKREWRDCGTVRPGDEGVVLRLPE